ncbi:MAG: class I SAM-dependent methyltransferase [Defluviitaleaceae bacterium]|nr:class I SAM-dependent methyltransferase [Defluviitaleaceae bacterium]MCL2274434.1 class I SAM-dependent methyltransferase [Defluviitaleaceae bacterium]
MHDIKNDKIVLFGGGVRGQQILSRMLNTPVRPGYIVDNFNAGKDWTHTNKYGEAYTFNIQSTERLLTEDKNNLVILVTPDEPNRSSIINQLIDMGLRDYIYPRKKMLGDRLKHCPVCDNNIEVFLPYANRINSHCPYCFSAARHRFMWLYLIKDRGLLNGGGEAIKILHFAPEFALYEILKKTDHIDYYPVDFNPAFPRKIRDCVDIQSMDYANDMFDVIICSHVLEHVPNDSLAMGELHRVLKPNGVAYINVPISDEMQTLENPNYNTPELREKYYGQHDHLRYYGADFNDKLQQAGFNVDIVQSEDMLCAKDCVYYAIENTQIFVCGKNMVKN